MKTDFNFNVSAYVKDEIIVTSQKVDVPVLQENYPYLEPIERVRHCYSDIEMIIGQNFITLYARLIIFNMHIGKLVVCLPSAGRLCLSGPLPSSSGLLSTCFTCNAEDVDFVSQVKAWYELENYGTYKKVDARSAVDQLAQNFLESTTNHDGERFWLVMLWADNSNSLPKYYYSALTTRCLKNCSIKIVV